MNKLISPKYQMKLASQVENILKEEYFTPEKIEYYIQKWHEIELNERGEFEYENFTIYRINNDQYNVIDITRTLHYMPEEILLKIAIDLGIDTPNFIPSIPTFKNEIKSDYTNASATFEKAIKQIETDPSLAIGLANSALESIIKEILKDERVHSKINFQKWYEEEWNETGDLIYENFHIYRDYGGAIDIVKILHNMPEKILLKIAIDLGIETPDFIPSIPTFKNEIKSDYKTASATFEKAIKQIETDPSLAIGLANSALESIIKEILKDERVHRKIKGKETLRDLTSEILKVFQMFPNADMPIEIRNIGSSLLSINQDIEKLRSEKTNIHGKTSEEYVIQDSMYAHFILNSVTTIGLFLISYYKKKFPKIETSNDDSDLPF